jgi:hypothetical protein
MMLSVVSSTRLVPMRDCRQAEIDIASKKTVAAPGRATALVKQLLIEARVFGCDARAGDPKSQPKIKTRTPALGVRRC